MNKDKTARTLAFVSLLVAALAIAIPFLQQQHFFKHAVTEQITVALRPNSSDPYKITEHVIGEEAAVVQLPWDGLLSNTGQQQLSIVKINVYVGKAVREWRYPYMDGGVFDDDGAPIQLPITLQPGESLGLKLLAGKLLPYTVYELLVALSESDQASTSDALHKLAHAGFDLYGNKVLLHEASEDKVMEYFRSGFFGITRDGYIYEWEHPWRELAENADQVWLIIRTGRGNEFKGMSNRYIPWIWSP